MPVLAFSSLEVIAQRPLKLIENPQTIGKHLKKRRLELKIRQKDVAKLIGVSEDSVTYWENERSVPQIQFYPKIIDFLGYYPFQTNDKTIGGQLKRYRYENGLSHRKLSKITGIDPGTLAAWESNKRPPSTWGKMRFIALNIL